ncbi:MAG: F0F1 ATP synthase subunit delta [bacterium]|nr:F0F1 ATP synthase subunit delta [bacterium]
MSLFWQLILIQVVTFLLIILFLRWLFLNQTRKTIKRLRELNEEKQKEEKALKEKIESAKKQIQEEMEKSKRDADEIRKKGRAAAEKEREEIIEKAKNESKKILEEASRENRKKEAELVVEMQTKSLYLAVDMIKQIFTDRNLEEMHRHFVDDVIDEIKKIDENKRSAASVSAVEIITSVKLSDSQMKKLKETLAGKDGKSLEFIEKRDDDIVAGIVVKVGECIIDGSLKNKLKKILPAMREKSRTV